MESKLFGFMIGDEIQVDIKNKRIIRIATEGSENSYILCIVPLKTVAMKLLAYLLTHANQKVVSKEELLYQIWEANNLSSSTQRLWQNLKDLKHKLVAVGIPDDFITNIRGRGYIVNYEKPITSIYLI